MSAIASSTAAMQRHKQPQHITSSDSRNKAATSPSMVYRGRGWRRNNPIGERSGARPWSQQCHNTASPGRPRPATATTVPKHPHPWSTVADYATARPRPVDDNGYVHDSQSGCGQAIEIRWKTHVFHGTGHTHSPYYTRGKFSPPRSSGDF